MESALLGYVAEKLKDATRSPNASLRWVRTNTTWMLPDGFLHAPIEVTEHDGTRRLVHAYDTSDAAAAAHYASVRAAAVKAARPEPVHYAIHPLSSVPLERSCVSPFGTHLFRLTNARPLDEMATWHATPEEPTFRGSAAAAALTRANRAFAGIHSYVLAAWLRSLGPSPASPLRVPLPQEERTVYLRAPEGRLLALSFSAKSGLQFHFTLDTPLDYQRLFWRHYGDYAEGWRREWDTKEWELDSPESTLPADSLAHLLQSPLTDSIQTVGLLPSTVASSPSA